MYELNQIADAFDLRMIHFVLSFVGIFLCAFAMNMLSTSNAPLDVMPVIGWLRRVGMWALALAMCWNVAYADYHSQWQPWPCDVATIFAIDFYMIASIVGAYLKRRETTQHKVVVRSH